MTLLSGWSLNISEGRRQGEGNLQNYLMLHFYNPEGKGCLPVLGRQSWELCCGSQGRTGRCHVRCMQRRNATDQLPQQNLLPTALEAESPGSRCQQAGFLLRPPSLVAVANLSCVLTWPFLGILPAVSSYWIETPPLRPHLILITSLEMLSPNTES